MHTRAMLVLVQLVNRSELTPMVHTVCFLIDVFGIDMHSIDMHMSINFFFLCTT